MMQEVEAPSGPASTLNVPPRLESQLRALSSNGVPIDPALILHLQARAPFVSPPATHNAQSASCADEACGFACDSSEDEEEFVSRSRSSSVGSRFSEWQHLLTAIDIFEAQESSGGEGSSSSSCMKPSSKKHQRQQYRRRSDSDCDYDSSSSYEEQHQPSRSYHHAYSSHSNAGANKRARTSAGLGSGGSGARPALAVRHAYAPKCESSDSEYELDEPVSAPKTKRKPPRRINNGVVVPHPLSRRGPRGQSRYKGVCITRAGKWRAVIYIGRKQKYLGVYDTEEEAAHAYDASSIIHFGPEAKRNFNPYSPKTASNMNAFAAANAAAAATSAAMAISGVACAPAATIPVRAPVPTVTAAPSKSAVPAAIALNCTLPVLTLPSLDLYTESALAAARSSTATLINNRSSSDSASATTTVVCPTGFVPLAPSHAGTAVSAL